MMTKNMKHPEAVNMMIIQGAEMKRVQGVQKGMKKITILDPAAVTKTNIENLQSKGRPLRLLKPLQENLRQHQQEKHIQEMKKSLRKKGPAKLQRHRRQCHVERSRLHQEDQPQKVSRHPEIQSRRNKKMRRRRRKKNQLRHLLKNQHQHLHPLRQ
jgi:hypothetical protein